MTHDDIVAANPIADFVRNRGHELKRAGENFVTSGCPKTRHKRSHRPVTIYKGDSWYCHDCKIGGSVIDYVMHERGCAAAEAMQLLGGGRNGKVRASRRETRQATKFDWQRCVAACNEVQREKLAEWRGYSDAFVECLHKRKLIGLHEGCIAFPVHDRGEVVAAHYRVDQGRERPVWFYFPALSDLGLAVQPLVIGDIKNAKTVHVFESQWDAFAGCDKLEWHESKDVAVIVTRGGGNGRLVENLISASATVYAWKQNDEPTKDGTRTGDEWLKDVVAHTTAPVKCVTVPAPHKDLNAWTWDGGATANDLRAAIANAAAVRETERPLIEFRSPLQLKNFKPPSGVEMVGDFHIVKGSVFVIGGAPGVGKSRATVALAEAGAKKHEWFGLTIHRKFKTMIVQTENGEFRLSREFRELDCDALEDFVRICIPPPYGLCFGRDDFRKQLRSEIAGWQPDAIIYDPWNAAARDDRQREYLETFEDLKSVLPLGDDAPALGIVAHTRKPKTDERASGRALLNLLAGSYVLGSVPRTVFVMQAASDETTDNRVVWTCCKNNDGELGARSAWERRNGLFAPVTDFDWEKFDASAKDARVKITAECVKSALAGGVTRGEAVAKLMKLTDASQTACYDALKLDGRFGGNLSETKKGVMSWVAD